MPPCGQVELSGVYSRNAGPRPLEYFWSVDVTNVTNQSLAIPDVIAMETIALLLPLNFTPSPLLSLPTAAFHEGYEYVFALRVRNFLNLTSDPTHFTMVTVDPAPTVLLEAVGGRRQSVDPQDDVVVKVEVSVTCSSEPSDSELSFMWELTDVTSDSVTDVTHLVDMPSLLTPVLWIPSLSLLPGHTYEASILATSGRGQGEEVVTETVTLETTYPSITVTFVGGAHQVVTVDHTLLLDITGSYSFDYYSRMDSLSVKWHCVQVAPDSAPDGVCSSPSTGEPLVLPAEARFTLEGGHLGVGSFRFTVNVTNTLGATVAMATLEYEVRPTSNVRGVVRIVEVARGRPYAVATDEVVLNGLVQTPEVGVVYWESVYIPGERSVLRGERSVLRVSGVC